MLNHLENAILQLTEVVQILKENQESRRTKSRPPTPAPVTLTEGNQ